MGSHDWNDGMNKVGNLGKGESVWLGFFLYDILIQFTGIASLYGDIAFVERCQKEAATLQNNLEQHGWDGEWYLRAYFDDGSPLGSAKNPECSIDSLSQSWAVLSGAGNPERTRIAMESVNSKLVNRENALVQLLDPPFDKSGLNPGYIKGYVPGVRENGGQYTHAAIWTAMAFAKMGGQKNAWDILSLINPINHGKTAGQVSTYKVEPYVISADVYSLSPHTGRGGWTWYTGSSGWLYRLVLESLLGIRIETDKLFIQPCLPESWDSFSMQYCYRQTIYRIVVRQTKDDSTEQGIVLDGTLINTGYIPLVDDQKEHNVTLVVWSSFPLGRDKL
jgi:cellobiose phosphorylase